MIIDKFPPWQVVKQLKGQIDIYIAHIGGGQCVIARSWPRKATIIKGSRYEETINGGILSMQSYKNQSAKLRLICSKINRTYDDYYLDHFRYGIQGYCIKTQEIAKVVTDIEMYYDSIQDKYRIKFFAPYLTDNYLIISSPQRKYYTTRKTVVKRGVRCTVRYRLRKTFDYFNTVIDNDNDWTQSYVIDSKTDLSITVDEPTVQDKQRAYIGPVAIEELYKIYLKS